MNVVYFLNEVRNEISKFHLNSEMTYLDDCFGNPIKIPFNTHFVIKELETKFAIKVRYYNDFFLLNYNQIDSPKNNPITNECRGLILDYNFNVLRRPFDRFFNYGECETKDFDFSKSVCMEKVDGSLLPIWYDPFSNRWFCGTRGTAYGEAETPSGRTFDSLVDLCFPELYKEGVFDKFFYPAYTYIFEFVSPYNRVVVPYEKPELVFLGARNNLTGDYIAKIAYDKLVRDMQNIGANVRNVEYYNLDNLALAQKYIKELDTPFFEGFVFWNPETDERVKVKNLSYVAIHHLRDNGNLNPKRICDLVFENETEEYLTYFSEDKIFFDPWINAYENLKMDIQNVFNENKNLESQKDFALNVIKYHFSSILFNMRKGSSLEECLNNISSSEMKVNLLKKYIEE